MGELVAKAAPRTLEPLDSPLWYLTPVVVRHRVAISHKRGGKTIKLMANWTNLIGVGRKRERKEKNLELPKSCSEG
jgi:hypothetical protein